MEPKWRAWWTRCAIAVSFALLASFATIAALRPRIQGFQNALTDSIPVRWRLLDVDTTRASVNVSSNSHPRRLTVKATADSKGVPFEPNDRAILLGVDARLDSRYYVESADADTISLVDAIVTDGAWATGSSDWVLASASDLPSQVIAGDTLYSTTQGTYFYVHTLDDGIAVLRRGKDHVQ